MTAPREYGILFQDEMVRGILRPASDPLCKRVTRRTSDQWAKRQPGDRLWVRECWAAGTGHMYDGEAAIRYRTDGAIRAVTDEASNKLRRSLSISRWRSSLVMPRWASRLTLEVVSVVREEAFGCTDPGGFCECQRLACFSRSGCADLPHVDDAEARLEGVADRAAYLALWRAINGDAVPDHLWRIEFRVVSHV